VNGKCLLQFTEEKLDKFSKNFPILTYGQKEKLLSVVSSLKQPQQDEPSVDVSSLSGYIFDDQLVSKCVT
jgi:hypothetical protein